MALRATGYLPKNAEPSARGKMRKIPVISWVAAGRWTETGETFLEEDVIEWIETDVKGEHNFELKIKGDSMEPDLSSPESWGSFRRVKSLTVSARSAHSRGQ